MSHLRRIRRLTISQIIDLQMDSDSYIILMYIFLQEVWRAIGYPSRAIEDPIGKAVEANETTKVRFLSFLWMRWAFANDNNLTFLF